MIEKEKKETHNDPFHHLFTVLLSVEMIQECKHYINVCMCVINMVVE